MNKTILIIIIFIIIITIIFFLVPRPSANSLVSPNFGRTTVAPVQVSPSPSPSVETFTFNSSTDLKAELEKVNPKVTDQDFQE